MKCKFDSKPQTQKIIIGLVGTSGSGKNEVARYFEKHDAFIIDADIVANEILAENKTEIIKRFKKFNEKIENPDGSFNKKEFANLVFSNSELLKRHEDFVFPLIENRIKILINQTSKKIIILNAPTLHKTKLAQKVNFFIFVTANYFLRLWRITKRDGCSFREAALRFKNQHNFFQAYKTFGKKIYLVKNNFSKKKLHKKIETMMMQLDLL